MRLLAGARDAPLLDRAAHEAVHGLLPPRTPLWLVRELGAAGLRGRGGAAYPFVAKLRGFSSRGGGVVVVNAAEGDPSSAKDATLLARAPHLVVDGAVAVATAWHAREVVVGVTARSVGRMREAAGAAPVPVRVVEVAATYGSGQATALARALGDDPARPRTVPPHLVVQGVGARPTLLSNAETWAAVGLVARHGGAWYASMGHPADPGTRLVTVSGAVQRPGVLEAPTDLSLGELLAAAGADPATRAVLLGGVAGTWLRWPDGQSLPLAEDVLRESGATLGVGAVEVLPRDGCPVSRSVELLRWLADRSSGQCGPCLNGLPALATAVVDVAVGRGPRVAVERLSTLVEGRGACHHPDGSARLARSLLTAFSDHVDDHAAGRGCRSEVLL